ncbi:MAG: DUF4416 family protein [Planctomycetes bacterium]|nr:DUF4416 family protein [Planctomycetota bacterium]
MGRIVPPQPVTPVLGVIYRDVSIVDDALMWVEHLMGDVELVSDEFPFDLTDHYQPEMGDALKRRFFSFDRLTDPSMLSEWKVQTNKLEEQLADRYGEQRPINLDPGYVTGAKLVLASVKGLAHRVYIGQGISAEVTLSFRDGEWLKRDYTFPDFKQGLYDAFFCKARERHLLHLGAYAQ